MPRLLFPIFLFFTFFNLIDRSVSEPRATQAAMICANRTSPMPQRQSYITSFLAAMDAVSPLINAQRYAAVSNGTGNSTVYAFGECMKDLSQSDCDLCFAQCKTQILRCLPFQLGTRAGRIFYDGCYLRYDDYRFFAENLSSEDKFVCGSVDFGGNSTVFGENVGLLVRNLTVEATKNDGFFVGSVNRGNVSVYGLAQCWEMVNRSGCAQCLNDVVSEIGSCPPKTEGRVLNAGCYFRYSTQKFYNNSGSATTGGNAGRRRLAVILAIVSSFFAIALIVATAAFCMKEKILARRRVRKQLGALMNTVNKSSLNFSYETLEKATNYFHNSNKLGQGGSGSVYKGILPDGKVVAIKRLFFNTRQWVDHFFNEVNLISGIDHKNLVKLLGCSITGPESLLVYEFVPNLSLNDHLFGKRDSLPLSWEIRFNIISGTAEGLAYLHEEATETIIHRDIKLSNVLLEDDFTVKIADFGLARLLPEDKSHISTGIAGTLGYMAPEYVTRGKLTEKADVYSFGVLVMEVVTGRRNNSFTQDSFSILQMVWSLYGSGKLSEAVDAALDGNFLAEEASRVLQVGLLCVQASAELRPSMSTVVKMLTMNHEIASPTQPPFLNPTSIEIIPYFPPKTYSSQPESCSHSSGNNMTESLIFPR